MLDMVQSLKMKRAGSIFASILSCRFILQTGKDSDGNIMFS